MEMLKKIFTAIRKSLSSNEGVPTNDLGSFDKLAERHIRRIAEGKIFIG